MSAPRIDQILSLLTLTAEIAEHLLAQQREAQDAERQAAQAVAADILSRLRRLKMEVDDDGA